ncbi:MAG: HEAT repeat domain-containing protein [Planctomycetaceae bacterium]
MRNSSLFVFLPDQNLIHSLWSGCMPRFLWCCFIMFTLLCAGFTLRALAQGERDTVDAQAESTELPANLDADLLLREPETATELLDTAFMMMRLGRFEQSRSYLARLLAMDLSSSDWLALNEHTGNTTLLRMARADNLHPESITVLDNVTKALQEYQNDPLRINALIDQLGGSAEEQELAILHLKNNSDVTLPHLIARLANNDGTLNPEVFTRAFTLIGKRAVPPLIAALQSSQEDVLVTAIEVLRFLKATEAAPEVLVLAYSPDTPPGVQLLARETLQNWNLVSSAESEEARIQRAAQQLSELALNNFNRVPAFNPEPVTLWGWDVEKKTVFRREVTPYEKAQHEGLMQTNQVLAMNPNSLETQALMLSYMLASERRNGEGDPAMTGQGSAHDLALSLGPELALKSLDYALEAQNHQAAYSCLKVLGEIGTANLLYTAVESPIVKALNSSDRAVQFAAAETILRFRPTEPYRNSNRVIPILAESLLDDGKRLAIIVGANIGTSLATANMFDQLRFETLVATTGKQGFRLAAQNRGVELIVLRPNTIHWPVSDTVANLRADARTAMIPIVIYGPPEVRKTADFLATRYPGIAYVQSTVESVTMRPVVEQLMKKQEIHSVDSSINNQQQRELAAYWLAQVGQFHSTGIVRPETGRDGVDR